MILNLFPPLSDWIKNENIRFILKRYLFKPREFNLSIDVYLFIEIYFQSKMKGKMK